MKKYKNIREARDTFNTDQNAVRLYYDFEEECYYTFVYPDLNSWEEFNDSNVKNILNRNGAIFGIDKVSYDDLKNLVEEYR